MQRTRFYLTDDQSRRLAELARERRVSKAQVIRWALDVALGTGETSTAARWIRAGRLKARKIGTQHIIEEGDLEALLDDEELPAPSHWGWDRLPDGRPMPNVVRAIRLSRVGR